MLSRLGRHLVSDYSYYYGFDQNVTGAVGIERAEFVRCTSAWRERIAHADRGPWVEFAALRGSYAVLLNGMARWWRIPPALWIGDRSSLQPGMRRRRRFDEPVRCF